MLLTESMEPYVAADVRGRGASYFRSGRVKLESAHPMEVLATVRGSRDYEVDLTLAGSTVKAFCTCPYDDLCKHIWATILAAEPRGFAGKALELGRLELRFDYGEESDDDEIEDRDARRRAPPRREEGRPKPKKESWKEQLAALRREVAPATTAVPPAPSAGESRLVYVVDGSASQQFKQLSLELNIQDRKADGEWGRPRGNNLSKSVLDKASVELDDRVLALLAGAERSDRYGYNSAYYGYGPMKYRVAPALLVALLPLLAQSGRLVLRRDPTAWEPLVPELDPPWGLTVSVHREGKNWVLAGNLRRGEEALPLSQPALLVPGLIVWNNRIGRFDDGGAFAWVQTLTKAGGISVPAANADELVALLLQMPNLPRLELPDELRYAELAVAPRPVLIVKASHHYGSHTLRAELSFDYDGASVPARAAGRGIFQPESKRFLLRDALAERAAEAEIYRLGARSGWHDGKESLEFKPSQLPGLVRQLVPAGWKVEADGKLFRQAHGIDVAVRSEVDWFDLNGSARFEGHSVPFPRLLAALRRGETSVPLDDGTFGMVPEDWLAKYGLLAKMGTVDGEAIRFSRAQVGVLDALLASRPEVTFDKQFARARDQLKKFQGVEPADPPKAFKGELREYQREGLGWLRFLRKFGFGGCLADDMGLGKTVQVLALLAGKRDGPALVVVPRSLIFNWKQEAAKFAPKLKVLDHTGTPRDKTGATFANFDLILTTYGTLRKDAEVFASVRFDTCILDESQAAKNAATETAKAVRVVRADHKLALSGTPVENHLGEIWTLFDYLNPGMLGRAMLTGGGNGSIRNPDVETREFLAKALRPFILRRTKAQVAKDLPEKTEQTVFCDLEPEQRKLYDELRAHYRQSLLARVDSIGLAKSKIHVLEALLRLRQAACHPGLIDKRRAKESSAKLDVLLPQLRELAEGGQKVLVFSQFTSLLAIVRSRLDDDGVTYEYLDGKTQDRAERVERFQTDADCKLFLISLKAGGVGLNLTAAEYVFLLDPWWNPAVEAQAIDRSHRIGQTKPVFAYRLIARNTVEEKVLALQQSKRELADAILGGDGKLLSDLKREDLEMLLS